MVWAVDEIESSFQEKSSLQFLNKRYFVTAAQLPGEKEIWHMTNEMFRCQKAVAATPPLPYRPLATPISP